MTYVIKQFLFTVSSAVVAFSVPLLAAAFEFDGQFRTLSGLYIFKGGAASVSDVINNLFLLLVAVGAVIAILRIAISGITYMLSESFTNKQSAISGLQNSVLGLVIVLSVVLVLNVINPTLTSTSILKGVPAAPEMQQRQVRIPECTICGEEDSSVVDEVGCRAKNHGPERSTDGTWAWHHGKNVCLVVLSSQKVRELREEKEREREEAADAESEKQEESEPFPLSDDQISP